MDSNTIYCCLQYLLRGTQTKTLHVIARDELYLIDNYKVPCAVVINCDDRKDPGSHFMSFFMFSRNGTLCIDWFDSYGLLIEYYNIQLPVPIKNYNTKVLQPSDSLTCSLYCIYFLRLRSLGYSLPEIVKRFTNNLRLNDYLVIQFYKQIRTSKRNRGVAQKSCSRQSGLFSDARIKR